MAINYAFTINGETVQFNKLDEKICKHLGKDVNEKEYSPEYLYLTHCVIPMHNNDITTLNSDSDFPFLKNCLQNQLESTKQLMSDLDITIHSF
jgi:hypothetical protein